MNDKEWEKFFELIDKIVNMEGTWQEKRATVLDQARVEGSVVNLDEFLGWFGGNMEE